MGKRKNYSYDIDSPFDYDIILSDTPFSQLNAAGRKAKKKYMARHGRK
jgi:hypothetical protein